MAKIVCSNPGCKTAARVPDTHIGRKVRCKVCKTVFIAIPVAGVASTATAVPAGGGSPVTVKARRVGLRESVATTADPAPAPRRAGCAALWLVLAVAGLVLPLGAAGGYVARQWYLGRDDTFRAGPGSLHAGIDIGSKGVKSVVLEVFFNPEFGYDVQPQGDPETVNTTLVAGLATNDHFDPDALADTARAVAKLYDGARTKYNVPEEHIYIVGSSGLFSALRKRKNLSEAQKEDLVRSNKEALAQAVQAKVGKRVHFIEAADEAEQLFKGIVPPRRAADAVMYDIGSGSTKGAYVSGKNSYTTLELPYGTKTYADYAQKEAKQSGSPPGDVVQSLADPALRQPLRDLFGRKPGFRNRDRAYLSGGIVWAVAMYVHPENRRTMVELKPGDVDTFVAMLDRDPQAIVQQCADRAAAAVKKRQDADKVRKEVAAEVKRVNDTFSPDEMRAGAEVFRALCAEGKLTGKKMYFARYGYFAWLLSYVQEKGAAQ